MVWLESKSIYGEIQEPEWTSSSDPKQVVKWCKTSGMMNGNQINKSLKLVNYGCVKYSGDNEFICFGLDTLKEVLYKGVVYTKLPYDKDYNKDPAPYVMRRLIGSEEWVCTCQWNSKMHMPCAHILALKIEFKRKKFGGK